jgi:hypothetical protein
MATQIRLSALVHYNINFATLPAWAESEPARPIDKL